MKNVIKFAAMVFVIGSCNLSYAQDDNAAKAKLNDPQPTLVSVANIGQTPDLIPDRSDFPKAPAGAFHSNETLTKISPGDSVIYSAPSGEQVCKFSFYMDNNGNPVVVGQVAFPAAYGFATCRAQELPANNKGPAVLLVVYGDI